jgi:uncharacterized repeat protein (TIGR01451 family)
MMQITALSAYAAGTPANTPVSNTAMVDYSISGTPQPTATSTTVTFVVDRKINFAVAEVGGAYTSVAAGALAQAMKFTVVNSSNDTMDFALSYIHDLGSADPFGGTDSFDATNVRLFRDSDGNGLFSPSDTQITTPLFLDEVAPDLTLTLFVVSDIPAGQPGNAISSGSLKAIAHAGGGAGLGARHTKTTGPNTPLVVDTVLADAAGPASGDVAGDGQASDNDAYKVTSATPPTPSPMTVEKSFFVVVDSQNQTVNPKAIPGATVEYCIKIINTQNSAASNVVVSDNIPLHTTFLNGSIVAGGTVTASGECDRNSGTSEDEDTASGDDTLSTTEHSGSFNPATKTVRTEVQTLAPSATTTTRFQVTID